MTAVFAVLLLVASAPANALDLEVYAGKLFEVRNYGLTNSHNPGFVSGLKVSEDLLWGFVTPSLGVETLMDGSRDTNSLVIGSGFQPTSVKYDVAVAFNVYKGFGIRGEHMCWHGIGNTMYGAATQQYTGLTVFYKYHADIK